MITTSKRKGINNIAFTVMLRALNERPRTKTELAEIAGVQVGTVIKWMAILEKQRLIYVDGWRHAGTNSWVALWYWGFMRDNEPKPAPATVAESCRKYRARKNARREKEAVCPSVTSARR